ncbi:MAG: Gfo/Idh/MocA family oxidoreductase [Isosphaeraceae bacterium]
MIRAVVVGYGLAGRVFHAPLIARQDRIELRGFVARSPEARAEAIARWPGTIGYANIDEALADPAVDLVAIATPHDTHADLCIRALEARKHCVVDKVMALNEAQADAMIAARDASGRMLSVFHNRRWDWDYLTLRRALDEGRLGPIFWAESAVVRHAPPRTWRGDRRSAGGLLHDWGAHLIDQALQLGLGPCRRLSAWLTPALDDWQGVDTDSHGVIVMEFDSARFQIVNSRACRLDRPRWWVLGRDGCYLQNGIDPQETALRAGDLAGAIQPPEHRAICKTSEGEETLDRAPGGWDAYYANIAAHLLDGEPLAVTAEQGREVVRVLDAAELSGRERATIGGPWGESRGSAGWP